MGLTWSGLGRQFEPLKTAMTHTTDAERLSHLFSLCKPTRACGLQCQRPLTDRVGPARHLSWCPGPSGYHSGFSSAQFPNCDSACRLTEIVQVAGRDVVDKPPQYNPLCQL